MRGMVDKRNNRIDGRTIEQDLWKYKWIQGVHTFTTHQINLLQLLLLFWCVVLRALTMFCSLP